MISVFVQNKFLAEKKYILDYILGEVLKLDYEIKTDNYPSYRFISDNHRLEINDAFFALVDDNIKCEIPSGYLEDKGDFVAAFATIVCSKSEGWPGVCIFIKNKKHITVRDMAHEAVHAADFIFEHLGLRHSGFDDGEAYAYLVGYISNCIDAAIKSKSR